MSKSTYHIQETKGCYKLSYSGDLKEAAEKARKDLQKEKENADIQHWEWIKKKAEAAITAHRKRIDRLEAFIRAADRELLEAARKKGD